MPIIRPIFPFVPILGAVTHHQKQASILHRHDQFAQQTKRERVVPVQILEDHHQRLDAALSQQEADDCLIRALSMLNLVEGAERIVLIQRIEKIQHWRNGVL